MSGTITNLGDCTVGQILPTTVATFGSRLTNLNAQLAAAGNLAIALNVGPPSMPEAVQIGATASAQAIASVTSPYFGLQITTNAALIASLQAQIAALGTVVAALGEAGVQLYLYQGTCDSLGSTLQAEVGGGIPPGLPADHVDALVLVAKTPAAFAAMQLTMKTT